MTKTQKNKRMFEKPFKGMFKEGGCNSLVHIDKATIVGLENCGKISHINSNYNNWYTVALDCASMDMVEMRPDYYKIVSGGQIGVFLRHYCWKYDGKNVYNCSIVTNKHIKIERVILNFDKYGFFKVVDIDKAAHHMGYRSWALIGMLKSMDKKIHLDYHRKIGNYDRGQCIEINSIADFDYLISVIDSQNSIMKSKQFSLEF